MGGLRLCSLCVSESLGDLEDGARFVQVSGGEGWDTGPGSVTELPKP